MEDDKKNQMTGLLRVLTPTEAKYYGRDIDWIKKARDQRESNWEFFDGLNFSRDYYLNRRAANTYLRPKKNNDEVRVNSGTTEKKIEVVANEILAMNFQHELRVFDKNDVEQEELGEDIGDTVTRTNQIERDEDFWQKTIWELLTQRAVFLQERFVKETAKDFGKEDRVKTYCKKAMLSGLKVFLGDASIPDYEFNRQPYYVTYDRIHKDEAKRLYGHLKNFKHTKAGDGSMEQYLGAFDFRLGIIDEDEYEVIQIKSYGEDYCQLYLNSMQMYKPETAESKLPWEHEGYDMIMVGLKGMASDWAYSKPLTASAKVMQGLSDESLRNLVRKWRQIIEPPLAVNGKKKYSRDIFQAGSMTYNLKAENFEKIVDHKGIDSGDVAMIDLINKKTEEFIGAGDLQQAVSTPGQTATETIELQRNFVKSLGFAIYAVKRMKRDMTYLRVYNIMENLTSPVSKELNPLTQSVQDIYHRFTLSEASIDGMTGRKEISFMDRDLEESEINQLYEAEKDLEKEGKRVRFKGINIKKLLDIPLTWFVNIIQKQPVGSALDKVMFKEQLSTAVPLSQMSGKPLNWDKAIEDFERKWEADDWFSNDAAPPVPIGMVGGVEGTEAGNQMMNGVGNPATKQPSVNTLQQNA